MHITILYFARLREALGNARERVEVPGDVATLGQLRAWLIARGDPWRDAFTRIAPIRAAVDHVVCGEETFLRDGAEVAFFPPVTGG